MPPMRLARSLAPLAGPAARAFHGTAARRVVHEVKSAAEFQTAVAASDRVVVDCSATWCGPCKAIGPVLARHSEAAEFRDAVRFVKFDVDAVPAVAQALGVRAMPTFVFFRAGKRVDELVGADPRALEEALRRLAA